MAFLVVYAFVAASTWLVMGKRKIGLYCYLTIDSLIKVLQKCICFFNCCHGNLKAKMLTESFYSCAFRWASVAHGPLLRPFIEVWTPWPGCKWDALSTWHFKQGIWEIFISMENIKFHCPPYLAKIAEEQSNQGLHCLPFCLHYRKFPKY